jgi:hypothetical protein
MDLTFSVEETRRLGTVSSVSVNRDIVIPRGRLMPQATSISRALSTWSIPDAYFSFFVQLFGPAAISAIAVFSATVTV